MRVGFRERNSDEREIPLKQLMLASALFSCGIIWGCGGSDSGGAASCGMLEPCGGDLVGTWKASGGCVNNAAVTMSFLEGSNGACPTATATATITNSSGTAQFKADQTYAVTAFVSSALVTMNFPGECLNGKTCADVQTSLRANPGTASATCTGTGSCQCTLQMQSDSTTETGTYAISGTSVVTTPSDGSAPGTIPYCVSGKTLHLLEIDTTMNMGPMGQATIDQDLLATKQ